MISIDGLFKKYGTVHALDGLSLHVPRGVVYGFLGPNGAGKTTTMRIISGLARADAGSVTVDGRALAPAGGQGAGADIRPLIGVLPEEPAFYPYMTAFEYLADLIAPLHGIKPAEARRRGRELLQRVDLSKAAKRRIHGFSRGMRQRLGIAAALVHRPPLLLLDEPVSALDPAGRKEVLDLIDEMRGDTTVLLSTHILADVERVCDVVGIVKAGKLIIQEERTVLLARYAVPVLEVEAEGQWDGWVELARSLPLIGDVALTGRTARITVADVAAAQPVVLRSLAEAGVLVRRFEVVHPSLEDVFLRLTNGEA
jgi:ABC-2 type transport system ATP-binding protein